MSEVLEPNNVNQLEGGHAGKLATLASEEVLASRYHRTQLWPICNNPVGTRCTDDREGVSGNPAVSPQDA